MLTRMRGRGVQFQTGAVLQRSITPRRRIRGRRRERSASRAIGIRNLEGFRHTRCFTECMDDDQLKEKLALWEVRPEIPPDFQRNVWQKIAVRESKPKLSLFGSWSTSWLRPPRLATCAIILGGLAGTGLGLIESSQANSRNWKTLEAKYVQSVDPYQQLRTY
jgi:hypothetical protein